MNTLDNLNLCNLSKLIPYFPFVIMVKIIQLSYKRKRAITNINPYPANVENIVNS
jgi:hypothetical protein